MKLVSMIDFVLSKSENIPLVEYNEVNEIFVDSTIKYANFLNQPLNLGMFVPAIEVGGKWEVFTDPNNGYDFDSYNLAEALEQYQQAKDRVLFEGFECVGVGNGFITIIKGNVMFTASDVNIIEDLLSFEPTLTAKGVKDSGLK